MMGLRDQKIESKTVSNYDSLSVPNKILYFLFLQFRLEICSKHARFVEWWYITFLIIASAVTHADFELPVLRVIM